MEVWIRSNRRALACGLIIPLVVGVSGAMVWWYSLMRWGTLGGQVAGGIMLVVSLLATIGLVSLMRVPRVGYRNGSVYFYLRIGSPLVVPLEAVELFLVGKTGAHVGPAGRPNEVRSVIARIRDRAKEFQEREVSSALGTWREGYITIRGTWCEPISADLLKRLNRRLRELARAGPG